MSESLRHPGPGSKYAIERGPNHSRHCRALSTAMWGYAATVARLTGIPERMLQFFMSPQSEKEGPFEKGARIVRALRELDAPSWSEPIRVLADEFGFDLAPRPEADGDAEDVSVGTLEAMCGMGRFAGKVREACQDDRVTLTEAEAIEAAGLQIIETVHGIIRDAKSAAQPAAPRRVEVGR